VSEQTPKADDYPLEYDANGYLELLAFLDRRPKALKEAASPTTTTLMAATTLGPLGIDVEAFKIGRGILLPVAIGDANLLQS
jgi:hypothetical protein